MSFLQPLLSPLHYTLLCLLSKQKQAEVKWPANLRHYNSPFFLCYWSLKQGPMGPTCNNDCLSIHVHTCRQTMRGLQQTLTMIPQGECWKKKTCRDLGQVFWNISWSRVFVSSDVKRITLKRKYRYMLRTMTNKTGIRSLHSFWNCIDFVPDFRC